VIRILTSPPTRAVLRRLRRLFGPGSPKPVPIAPESADRGKSPDRFLLVAYFDPHGISTILENIYLLGRLSSYQFDVLNLYGKAYPSGLELPRDLRLQDYDGLFLHCTVSYNGDNLASLDRQLPLKLRDFEGLKILMKQDEHYRTNRVIDFIEQNRIDLVLTCVPPEELHKVYPPDRVRHTRFLTVLTGYVSDELRQMSVLQSDPRPIDVGYRGSLQPFCFGRLAYEKRQIGDAFSEVCRARGLSFDISSRWEDRFHGAEWFAFLSRIKAVLGVESGASVFDFTGDIERNVARYLEKRPKASFEEVHDAILRPYEGDVRYNQISPRHFEAAACRTVQILYAGDYSGIFEPGRHYLSLERDFSNLADVLERFTSPAERMRMTEAAFEEIILDDRYSYSTFVRQFDQAARLIASR